jgi:uncharacterized protein (DUF58 family)
MWPVVVVYHAALVLVAAADLRRLPRPASFTAQRSFPRPLSLGVEESIQVAVRCPAAAGMAARVGDHAPAGINPRPPEITTRFDAGGVLEVAYRCHPDRRGAYRFGPVDVRCGSDRGWWWRQVRIPAAEEVAVYPDVVQIRTHELSLRRGLRPTSGLRRARPPGSATTFAALRDYVPGDDIRRIHWKASARQDRPISVEVEAERGQQVVIAIDCGRLMTARARHLMKLDHAVNAALLLGWVAQSQGDRVGMLTFADRVLTFLPPQRGSAQINRLSRTLYAVEARYTEPDFAGVTGFLTRRVNRRSLVVLLTDVLDPEASNDLVANALHLSRRHLVLVAAMADPALLEALSGPIPDAGRAFEWAAAEELMAARRTAFDVLSRGGVLGLDAPAEKLSPSLVERYLELKERSLV